MATKRKALSKKTRFDVFKRDKFTCQYCGAHPPGVLLHVDHIVAVAEGGTNTEGNLTTSCEACNLGKGARPLNVVPESLAERAKRVAEAEAQLLGYQEVFEVRREQLDDEAWRVIHALFPSANGEIRMDWFLSVRRFVEKLGVHEVLGVAEWVYGLPVQRQRAFQTLCSMCWKRIEGTPHA